MFRVLEAIIPGPRRLLICALYTDPTRWWSAPDLAGNLGMASGGLRKQLDALVDGSVARVRREGPRTLYQANPDCPVFSELHSLVTRLSTSENPVTILIVEDQTATAQITRILLESWGYRALEAHSAREARVLFREHRDRIDLLLTDILMPETSGPQLVLELAREKPDLRVVFMSGAPENGDLPANSAFLAKPFNPASLARVVRRQLSRKQMKTA